MIIFCDYNINLSFFSFYLLLEFGLELMIVKLKSLANLGSSWIDGHICTKNISPKLRMWNSAGQHAMLVP
jgi:hypothetical protein